MAFRATVKHEGTSAVMAAGPEALKSHINKATDAGLVAAVRLWIRRYMLGHFREIAVAKYGYKQRSFRYSLRKRKRFKHNRPLVFTGRSLSEIRAGATVTKKIRGGSRKLKLKGLRGAEMKIKAPKYFFQYKPGKSSDKADELTRITQEEGRVLDTRFKKVMHSTRGKLAARRRKIRRMA